MHVHVSIGGVAMNLEQQMPPTLVAMCGLALGVLAGIGVVALTPRRRYRGAMRTEAITVALYAVGGLAAGAVASYLDRGARAGAHQLAVSEDELGRGTIDGTTWIAAVELRAPGNLDDTGGAM